MSENFILHAQPLFDKNAIDSKETQQIFGGQSTGISNLNDIKYDWVAPTYRLMVGNHWVPEKVDMSSDKITIKTLTEDEDDAVKNTLSFLIFLDSFQSNNLPNIKEFTTCPGVANLIGIQLFQEIIHSQSYQVILDALYPFVTREEIYNKWRTNANLLKRNEFIAGIANEFLEKKDMDSFKRVLVANFILEGIYFYNGFNLFYQLASRQKLMQTSKMIKYIENDELTHMGMFKNILREVCDPVGKDREMIVSMIEQAVEHEVEWNHSIYGNRILGISESSSEQYVKWLANDRAALLGIPAIYEGVSNPYKYLDGATRENFFEVGAVTEYAKADTVTGWDFQFYQ